MKKLVKVDADTYLPKGKTDRDDGFVRESASLTIAVQTMKVWKSFVFPDIEGEEVPDPEEEAAADRCPYRERIYLRGVGGIVPIPTDDYAPPHLLHVVRKDGTITKGFDEVYVFMRSNDFEQPADRVKGSICYREKKYFEYETEKYPSLWLDFTAPHNIMAKLLEELTATPRRSLRVGLCIEVFSDGPWISKYLLEEETSHKVRLEEFEFSLNMRSVDYAGMAEQTPGGARTIGLTRMLRTLRVLRTG